MSKSQDTLDHVYHRLVCIVNELEAMSPTVLRVHERGLLLRAASLLCQVATRVEKDGQDEEEAEMAEVDVLPRLKPRDSQERPLTPEGE